MNLVYLDANFLVDWLVRKDPSLRKRARRLLARLLQQFDGLAFSTLTIDEFWKVIKEELARRGTSCSDPKLFARIDLCTRKVLSGPKVRVVQFGDPANGIITALCTLKKHVLEPRDSFHLAIMRDNGISVMATRDRKFINRQVAMGIRVIQ